MTLTPGQVVWYVPNYGSTYARDLTITKVGRKWAETDSRGLRVEIGTNVVSERDYGERGIIHESKEVAAELARLDAAWNDLRIDAYNRRSRPAHMTLETIAAARRLLGLEVMP